MSKGIDMARETDIACGGTGIAADLMDNFKEQLVVCLLKRLQDKRGVVRVPVAEVDATGDVVIMLAIRNNEFIFEVKKKQ